MYGTHNLCRKFATVCVGKLQLPVLSSFLSNDDAASAGSNRLTLPFFRLAMLYYGHFLFPMPIRNDVPPDVIPVGMFQIACII